MDGVVYTINKNNEIIDEFEYDFNMAIAEFHGQRTEQGNRYWIGVKEKEPPFPRKKKNLKEVFRLHSQN